MRISTLARRSVATLAATALLSTGGAVLGLTVGVANAQTVTGVSRAGGGAAIGVNNGPSAFQVEGNEFMPHGQQAVRLQPNGPIVGQGAINGVVRNNSAQCEKNILGIVQPDATCSGPLLFDVNLSLAAPGTYDVIVTQSPQTGLGNVDEVDVCVKCILVVSAGPATVTGVAPTGTNNGPLTITGSNFANGARVEFYNTDANGAATTVDPLLHFTATSLPNSSTLNGNYSADPGAVGSKVVRVFNVDDPSGPGAGGAFVQPLVTGVSPATLGQGATAIPVTVTGGGFNASSTVAWSDPKVTAAGPITVAANGNSFVVPTSVASDTALGGKTLTVKGTGGGFTTFANALTVTASPKPTSVTPATRGQGSSSEVTVNGSGFTGSTVFSFGQGITATTNAVTTTPTAAKVNLVVTPDADLGARSVTATNPDKGTTTLANALNVVAKPVIAQIAPASGGPSESVPVTITGSGFDPAGVTITVSGANIAVGSVVVDSPTQIRATFTAAAAAFGPRDVTIVNNASQGQSTCVGCYGVNSLSITPNAAANTGPKTLTLTGAGVTASTVVKLTIPGPQDYQAPITGVNVGCASPAANTICSTFNLTGAASGRYTVTAVTGSSTLTCTSCFTVATVADPAPTSAAPATGGQGAVDRTVVINGTNFSPGETVTFSGAGITTTDVSFNSTTKLTAVISIAEDAATGPRSITVRNIGDGRSGTTAANAFTVVAGPKTTSVDIHALGQNAVTDVTLTGTGYVNGATVSFGPGTAAVVKSISATQLVATVTVADTADTAPIRDIRVTNPDGGSGALVGQFKVNPAPRITSIAPGVGKAGETKSVVISGSGFTTRPGVQPGQTSATVCPAGESPAIVCPTVIVAGLLATVKTVSIDGTSMTADFAIGPQAPISNPAARVINPDRGQSTKTAAFRIATVPVAPTNVAAVVTGSSAKVTWAFPTTTNADGGSPLTGFIVDDNDATTNNTQTVAPDVREATFAGLTAGKVYTFTVRAVNAVGTGPAGTAATSQFVTGLTATRSKPVAAPGDYIRYTGKLTRTANGAGAPNAAIIVTLDPDVGPTRVFTTHTNAIGVWGFRFFTYYNMTVSAKFLGNATDKASASSSFRLPTVTRVVKKSPSSGSSTPTSSRLVVTGYTFPNKAGRTVYLVKGNGALVARAIVASDSTYTFRTNLGAGNHLLAVRIVPGSGNIGGSSPFFAVKRT